MAPKPVVLTEGGEHVMFSYEGLGTGVQEFILTVYVDLHADAESESPQRSGTLSAKLAGASMLKPEEGPINLAYGIPPVRYVVNAATRPAQGIQMQRIVPLPSQPPTPMPAGALP